MKILLQDICKANYHWDGELDSELKTRWMTLISEFGQVNAIQIPGCVTSEPDTKEMIFLTVVACEIGRNSYFAGADQRAGSGVWWEFSVICCTNSDPLEI